MLEILGASLLPEVALGATLHTFPDRGRELPWLEHLAADPDGGAWVAEVDAQPAGFGIRARCWGVPLLAVLLVSPEHQGRGLGRGLLAGLWPADCGGHTTLVDPSSGTAFSLFLREGLVPSGLALPFKGALSTRPLASGTIRSVDACHTIEAQVKDPDRNVFAASRLQDRRHRNIQGYAFRGLEATSGDWLGYAHWCPTGCLGPVALVNGEFWPQALAAPMGEMSAAGIDTVLLMVPGNNFPALCCAVDHGFGYHSMEVALATQTTGDRSRCLVHRAAPP